jgi:hypothetical protein
MRNMPTNGWSPGIVPYGADETAYLVVDSFSNGTVYRETEIENADPLRVIAFNTLEHWSDDVSGDIAAEIQTRCDIEGIPVPEHITDFVEAHQRPTRQLALRPI